MLQEAIEKNRGFLKVCAVAAIITGAVSLGTNVFIWMQTILRLKMPIGLPGIQSIASSVHGVAGAILRTIVLFALADLIRWALDRENRPGWMLMHVDKIIYLQVVLTIAYYFVAQWIVHQQWVTYHMHAQTLSPWRLIGPNTVLSAASLAFASGFGVLKGIAAGKGVRLMEEYRKSREVASEEQGQSEK